MGRAGLEVTNEINKLGVPTAPDRGVECKDEFRPFPNLPNHPPWPLGDDGDAPTIADLPPGLWWRVLPEYPPESSNPLLDAWLSTNDAGAWIQALGEIEARAELEALNEGATDDG